MATIELPSKYRLLGVGISRINLRTGTEAVVAAVLDDRKGYITITGVHGVIEAQDDPEFMDILNGSLITTPDGMPTVWGGWINGYAEMGRVYGPDLMLEVMKVSSRHGLRHFFYGGKEGVAELLKTQLEKRFPGVLVIGTYCPPFRELTEDEGLALGKMVHEAAPDIVWVGLSTPRQERFMASYVGKLDTKLMIGVGAAFDFHAGLLKQAPRCLQRIGLEWLYRLVIEPKRLWSRYCNIVPRFVALVGLGMVRRAFRSLVGPDALGRVLLQSQIWLIGMAVAGCVAGWLTGANRLATVGMVCGSYALMLLCAVFVLAASTASGERRLGFPGLLWALASVGVIAASAAPFAYLFHMFGMSKVLHWSAICLSTAAALGWLGALLLVFVSIWRRTEQ